MFFSSRLEAGPSMTRSGLFGALATMQMFKASLERLSAATEVKCDAYGNRLLLEEAEQIKGLIEVLGLLQAGTTAGLEHHWREVRRLSEPQHKTTQPGIECQGK